MCCMVDPHCLESQADAALCCSSTAARIEATHSQQESTYVVDHGLVVCSNKDPAVRQQNRMREELFKKMSVLFQKRSTHTLSTSASLRKGE